MKYFLTNQDSITKTANLCNYGDEIYLKKGIYTEKVEILKEGISIIGEDKEQTILTNHDYYHKIMEDYNECNTFRSYTCYIGADHVRISNVTIENSSVPSNKYGQAVALHVNANDFVCKDTILKSSQDTLFLAPLPENLLVKYVGFLREDFLRSGELVQIFKNCTIYGDVDFIFGGGIALFEECDIISKRRETKVSNEASGYIAAPSHLKDIPYGFLFYKCHLIAEKDTSNVYLARPWRDYGAAAFIDCTLGNHIHPLGFNKWGSTERDKTARFYEYSPNVDLTSRESWAHILSGEEATKYYNGFMSYIKSKIK